MLVQDGMTSPVITAPADMKLLDVAALFAQHRIHQAPVVDRDGILVGIITDRDIRDARAEEGFDALDVASTMSPAPLTLRPDDTIEDAVEELRGKRFGALPVVDDKHRVLGIFTRHEALKVLSEMLGFDAPGSRLEVHFTETGADLKTTIGILAEHQAKIISAALTPEHHQEGRRLFVRLRSIDASPIEQAFADAGLKVIMPAGGEIEPDDEFELRQ